MVDFSVLASRLRDALISQHLDPTAQAYCHAEEYWDHSGDCSLKKVGAIGEFEKSLEQFFRSAGTPSRNHADAVLILVGGVGSGKSTAVRQALYNAKIGNAPNLHGDPGNNVVWPIVFDFLQIDPEGKPVAKGSEIDAALSLMWRAVTAALIPVVQSQLHTVTEVQEAWFWITSQPMLLQRHRSVMEFFLRVEPELRALRANEHLGARAPQQLFDDLIKARAAFLAPTHDSGKGASAEEVAWFYTCLLAYATRFSPERRPLVVILDNIDHCDPLVQERAYHFAIVLGDVLRGKTLVTMRPMTRAKIAHGGSLVRELTHANPLPSKVISKRVDAGLHGTDLTDGERRAVHDLLALLNGVGDPLFSNLFRATSGVTLRAALKNFANMLSSPVLSSLPERDPLGGVRPSNLARALFFFDGAFNHDAFEHLYRVDGDFSPSVRLIKPRVLDWLARFAQRSVPLRQLTRFGRKFEYSDEQLWQAIDELMSPARPLIWSEDGLRCPDLESPGRISLTYLGRLYIESLFGEYLYEEVCIAPNDQAVVSVSDVLEFSSAIEDVDVEESRRFRIRNGVWDYRGIYPSAGIVSISFQRWRRLLSGLKKRATDERVKIDVQRENVIEAKIKSAVERG